MASQNGRESAARRLALAPSNAVAVPTSMVRGVSREGMVEEIVKTYRVAYERDESGWWVASVRGVRGCHTQGRTVDEARRRIREALELFVDDARRATILDDVKLPSAATRAIRAYASLRKKADEEDRRAARAARRAVRVLRTGKLKMSARDAARLLGLSHQRVHQLTQDDINTPRLSHARANSSLNAWRRQYCWRRSVAHLRISAARLLGAKAMHDATSSAA